MKWRAITVDESGVVTRVGNQGRQLADPEQFMGFSGNPSRPDSLLFRHHDLHIEVQFDRAHQIGSTDKAGVSNVVLESALSTIMDLEGSVAAVDAGDKVVGYRNWLRLMQGTLTEDVTKDGRTFRRTLNADRVFTALSGESVTMPGGVAVQSGRPDIS
ncbi:hypothetical protein AADR41_30095 [Streptomyces sp. CLV115]|uniref:hypothetical protein n=1 Tax=Streptomyces sp. CLV115 TaxID=3138502 RepID=UPI00313C4B30